MRVAFLVAASSVLVCATVSFLACSSSSSDGATSDDGGGALGTSGNGTSGNGTSGSGTSGGGGCASPTGEHAVTVLPDGGPKRAPNGCLLFGTDILEGSTAENVAAAGKIDWTSPRGALVPSDNQLAQVILSDGQESATLKVSGFCLDVPSTADIWGIVVELKRRTLTENGVLQTSKTTVSIPNTGFKFDDATFFWPRSPTPDGGYGTHAYGQEIDSWGVNLQPSDFGPGFYTTLAVRKSPDGGAPGPITGSVDSLRLQVWYATGTEDKCQK